MTQQDKPGLQHNYREMGDKLLPTHPENSCSIPWGDGGQSAQLLDT